MSNAKVKFLRKLDLAVKNYPEFIKENWDPGNQNAVEIFQDAAVKAANTHGFQFQGKPIAGVVHAIKHLHGRPRDMEHTALVEEAWDSLPAHWKV